MENASKALLIAGGTLIAILVLTLIVYVSRNMADETSKVYKQLEESRRTEFNQKFLKYNNRGIDPDSEGLEIQDVITIIHLAQDSNKENGLENYTPTNINNDNTLYVQVDVNFSYDTSPDKKRNVEKYDDTNIANIIKEEMKLPLHLYTCKVRTNSNTGYVNYIEIV